MADTALVPVFSGTLQSIPAQLCDARALHAFMEVKRDFTNWVKGRIRKFGFVEGVDYLLANSGDQVLAKVGANLGGRPAIDYHLSLDMAKELAMVENNPKGREARRYFIACEKAVMQMQRPHNPALDYDRISPAQAQDLKELVHGIVDAKVQGFAETWARLHKKFRVNSYMELPAARFEDARDYLLGKLPQEPARHIDPLNSEAMTAARNVAMNYFQDFRSAAKSGGGSVSMQEIPAEVLQGLLAEAMTRSKMIASFDHQGQLMLTPIPSDASVISLTKGNYTSLVSQVPMERLPELVEKLNKRMATHLGAFRDMLGARQAEGGPMRFELAD
jgi:phage anti-repressor protein